MNKNTIIPIFGQEVLEKEVTFELDGQVVDAHEGETIWQVAKREGIDIPHLCWRDENGYRSDGNCRACMVEIEGERTLAASCCRKVGGGLVVNTNNDRVRTNRKLVFELLASDMPSRKTGPDPDASFWHHAESVGLGDSPRFEGSRPAAKSNIPVDSIFRDVSHPSIAVNLDACIACGLCERACREVQVNDVIGMGFRGHATRPVFDSDDPMGLSSCVACGECIQACPTGALMEKSLLDSDSKERVVYPDKVVESVCPFCGVGCQTSIEVKNNKIIKVDGREGPANKNRLCIKGRFGFDYVNSRERLTKPLIRRDGFPKRWDVDTSPNAFKEAFREATWEEVLSLAADGLNKIIKEHGGDALAGFGSAKGTNEEAYLFQKLVRQGFGTNNVDHCTRLCHASSVAALMEGVGSGAVSAPFSAAKDADCIIIIGARPEQNHPVAATFIKQAAKRGATLIVMDPRYQGLMRHAQYSLVFKPGTDVALLNSMLNVIVNEKLYNEEYIEKHVEGFEALREKVRDFDPDSMEEVCGIDSQTIREVARAYATSQRSIIFWGMGVSQHVHGTDNARCLIALALSTGQVGRPGTGLHPLRGQNNVQGASDAGLIPMVFPDYRSVENPDFRGHLEDLWGTKLDANKGLTVVETMHAIHDRKVKGMFVQGENPAMSDPDQKHARQALAMLDHLIVQDIFPTETAFFADVILPASSQAEKLGTYTNTNRQIQIGKPAVDLPGEARQDWELIVDIANRIGCKWDYKDVSDVYKEMGETMDSLNNISWERLLNEQAVTYPAKSESMPGTDILFGDGFPTKNGKGKIVPADLIPPDELPDEEFPLILTTGRMLEHWHTGAMTSRSSALNAQEPDAIVSMHPKDIGKMGFERGDRVRVETRRGEITLKLRADRDVTQGMLFIPFCFNDAPANFLTNPSLDPVGKIPEFKFCAAKVSRLMA